MELFLKYGGMTFWVGFIDEFYARVTECPELQSFFAGKDQKRIKDMQLSLIEMALTGEQFPQEVVREVHKRMGIGPGHFTKFMDLYQQTLSDLEMEPDDISFLTRLMFEYREEIVPKAD